MGLWAIFPLILADSNLQASGTLLFMRLSFEQLRHRWIRLQVRRWIGPALCAIPYVGSILWLLGRDQLWIAGVMLSPLLVMALLISLTWLLAQLEFRGSWRG